MSTPPLRHNGPDIGWSLKRHHEYLVLRHGLTIGYQVKRPTALVNTIGATQAATTRGTTAFDCRCGHNTAWHTHWRSDQTSECAHAECRCKRYRNAHTLRFRLRGRFERLVVRALGGLS